MRDGERQLPKPGEGGPAGSTSPLVVVHALGRLSPGGGVQVVVRGLAGGLDPSEIDLHVVTSRPWREVDDVDGLALTLHPLDFAGNRLTVRVRARLMVGVARWVRRLRADVVQVHSGIGWLGLLARCTSPRAAFVLEVHDAPGSGRHGARTDSFEGWMVRRLGVVAVCHSRQVEAAIGDLWHTKATSVRRFPLGVDTDMYVPVETSARETWRKENGIDPGSFLLVGIGRGAPSKRFDLAIDVAAAARAGGAPVELVIIGPGEMPNLRERAEAQGISDHVHLFDSRYDDDLAIAVASADVLVSTSEYEGFGLTLVEGMACGLPVVAMSVGGVVDLVDDGVTGHLVTSGDVAEHAGRIVELAADPDAAAAMGAAGRARVEALFSHQAVARNFTHLYQELARR